MPTTTNPEGRELYYEVHGDAADPTLLLVNGLGSQLINWDKGFIDLFVAGGHQVIVYDNRDVGLSGKTDGPAPDVLALFAQRAAGKELGDVPYRLSAMAADGMAVLDALGVERAHVAGMSMGGMIVQRMAIDHPGRVLSMTSIMSTTGAPEVGAATPEAMQVLLAPPPPDRDGAIANTVATIKVISGDHFSADHWQVQAALAYDRCFHPTGTAFQLAAIGADGDRTAELGALSVPTLVIHGRQDPLITLSGGEATAAAVPGADLVVLGDMGHDLPPPVWGRVTGSMLDLMARAGG